MNGVAGGVIRDVLVGDVPQFFRPGQLYGSIVLVALLLYWVLLRSNDVSSNTAAWVAISLAASVRWLVIRYNWQAFAVNELQVDPAQIALPHRLGRTSRK
ncbi:MAG: TRIC cation channel family protein [Caldilineaceae bacterium]|nr:TRIC cation channel family protein [Caldilineaceae bacterium]